MAQAVLMVNNHWGSYRSPRIKTFCLAEPTVVTEHVPGGTKDKAKPRGFYAWEALDANGRTHCISVRWVVPSY